MSRMQGLSLQSIKKNPAVSSSLFLSQLVSFRKPIVISILHNLMSVQLIPLYVCVGIGAVGACGYLLRLATKNPDVTWNRTKNPEPWQEYKDKQYKVLEQKHYFIRIYRPNINFLLNLMVLVLFSKSRLQQHQVSCSRL